MGSDPAVWVRTKGGQQWLHTREKDRERDGKKREREGEEVGRELQRQGLRVRIGTEIITKVRIYVQLESGVKSWVRVCRPELGFG